MSTQDDISPPSDAMFRQAAEWATRAESGRFGSEDFSALEDWLSADRRHLLAFKRMQGLLDRTDGMPLPLPQPKRQTRGIAARRALLWLPVAAAVAMIAVLATIVLPLTSQTIATQPGEIRSVSLGDGSTLVLRGDTRLQVNYGWSLREIDLQRGEAAFEVASHWYKPFVVRSDSIQVVAVGTVFNVAVSDSESTVTLIEGRVDVGAAHQPIPDSRLTCRAVRLKVGQKVAYRPDGSRSDIEQADIAQVTAWQDNQILLQRRPLAELVDELNRAFGDNISIGDPALAGKTVNVSMKVDSREVTLRRLEQQLQISFSDAPGGGTIVTARDQRQ